MLCRLLKFLLGLSFLISSSLALYAAEDFREGKHRMPKAYDQLYYFVSFSMPEHLMKDYLQEAGLNNGVLILKGILPHQNLHDFLMQTLWPLLQDPENAQAVYANFEINPDLFEQYGVTKVPTLVYVKDKKHYWKVSGPVTAAWAMEAFNLHKSSIYGHEQIQ